MLFLVAKAYLEGKFEIDLIAQRGLYSNVGRAMPLLWF